MSRTNIVHYSLNGVSLKLAERLGYPYYQIGEYVDDGSDIVIIGRPFYRADIVLYMKHFIEIYKSNIIGVIILDDMNYGSEFANFSEFYSNLGVPILQILDYIVTDEQINELREGIDNER